MDYYDILLISKSASAEEIHQAYRTLAKKYHPDVFDGDKEFAEEQMKFINEAYSVLSNPTARKEYDKELNYTENDHNYESTTKEHNTDNVDKSSQDSTHHDAAKQPLSKPFLFIRWPFITIVLFFCSLLQSEKLFWVGVLLTLIRLSANLINKAYRAKGVTQIISICIIVLLLHTCYTELYNDNSSIFDADPPVTIYQTETESRDTMTHTNTIDTNAQLPLDLGADNNTMLCDIWKATNFSEGIAFIGYFKNNYQNHFNYIVSAIDTSGNILFDLEGMDPDYELPVIKGGIYILNNSVYNTKGQLIASPNLSGYDEIYDKESKNGCVIVIKYVESYKGDKVLVGVINNNGEWIVPLCENGEWQNTEKKYTWETLYSQYSIREESINCFYEEDDGIYKIHYDSTDELILPDFYNLGTTLNMAYVYSANTFFDNAFIGGRKIRNDYTNEWSYEGYALNDYLGNKIIDLSKYDILTTCDIFYYNGYLLFTIDNGTGSNYLCFLNPSGDFVMDPIKLEDPYHVTSNFSAGLQKYFALDEYGFVVKLDDENYYHVDYNGNMTKYSNIDRFYGFNDGLSLVRNKNDSYYFINYEGDVIIDYIRR